MSKDDTTASQTGLLIQDHVTVRDIVTFKSGGVADYFVTCQNPEEIVTAVTTALERKVPYRVIGRGSNILFSDSGFPGLIIQNTANRILFIHDRSQVIVDSGVPIELLISRCASLGYSGLEFLYGYPGSIGGAVVHNRGQAERSIGQYVRSATILVASSSSKPSVRRKERDWFEFTTHGSQLKTESQSHPTKSIPIILTLTLQLSRMSHTTCTQRLQEAARANKKAYHNQPVIQAFTNLNPTRQQIRQWRSNTVSVLSEDPNYLRNHNQATSKEAALLINRIIKESASTTTTPHCSVDFVGLWESDELP